MKRPHIFYRSTRGREELVSFREAMLRGLAPDGGLYIPDGIPDIGAQKWVEADTFAELGQGILGEWLAGEFETEVIHSVVADALSFPVPLVPVGSGDWDDIFVLELFHGPTLSFKDVGARTMARLMNAAIEEGDRRRTVLVATSGDTGSAVADAYAGLQKFRVVLLYPHGMVSEVQERQLIAPRPNVTPLAVDGSFDDCQRLVKEAFVDGDMTRHGFTTANSINIGRLLPQMLYYFWAVRQGTFSQSLICVPSGNLGNLTGGVFASMSGLNTPRFIGALNANDCFWRYLRGEASGKPVTKKTLSNAMDVGIPSNLERLQAMFSLETLRAMVWATSVTDEETLREISNVHHDTGYVCDPHTAVGLASARRYRKETGEKRPIIVLSTAHPAKFPDIIERALGVLPEVPERLSALIGGPKSVRRMSAELSDLSAILDTLD